MGAHPPPPPPAFVGHLSFWQKNIANALPWAYRQNFFAKMTNARQMPGGGGGGWAPMELFETLPCL